jgi:hypothetical protein
METNLQEYGQAAPMNGGFAVNVTGTETNLQWCVQTVTRNGGLVVFECGKF